MSWFPCFCTSRSSIFKCNRCSLWFCSIKFYIKFWFSRLCTSVSSPYRWCQRLSNNFMVEFYLFTTYLTISDFRIYRHRNIDFCRSITLRTNRYSFSRISYCRCCWLTILPSNTWTCYPCRNFHKITWSVYIWNISVFNSINRFRLHSNYRDYFLSFITILV